MAEFNASIGFDIALVYYDRTGFFFFKQKTAYEVCGRDWSSDVCSSDLTGSKKTGAKEERKEEKCERKREWKREKLRGREKGGRKRGGREREGERVRGQTLLEHVTSQLDDSLRGTDIIYSIIIDAGLCNTWLRLI